MNNVLEQSTNARDFLKWKREINRALSAKGVFDTIEVPATSTSKASARKDAVAKTVIFERLHDELSRNIEDSKLSAHELMELITSKFEKKVEVAAANALSELHNLRWTGSMSSSSIKASHGHLRDHLKFQTWLG